jgi:hypothetical protein
MSGCPFSLGPTREGRYFLQTGDWKTAPHDAILKYRDAVSFHQARQKTMRGLSRTLGAAALLLASVSDADMLHFQDGGAVKGVLEEVTFLYKSLHKMVGRDQVKALTIGSQGSDVLVLASGREYVGKLVAIRFRTSSGISTISRSKIQSLSFDAEWAPEKPTDDSPAEKGEEEPEKAEEKEAEDKQNDVLDRNKALFNACVKKAKEIQESEEDAVDAKYANEKKQIENDLRRLLRNIDRKQYERRSGRAYRDDRGRYTDGLERDYRDLAQAKKKRNETVAKIKKDKEAVDEKAQERLKRIKVVWSAHRRAIAEGTPPEDEQMIANYKKALQAPPDKSKN